MEYCPFCSGPINKPAKVCPHCKKALDLHIYQSVFEPGETTETNKKALRKLWFKEHSRFLIPFLFLLIGLSLGAAAMFGYSALHFQLKQNSMEQEITTLNSRLNDAGANTASLSDSLNTSILARDTVVQILAEKNKLLRQIIAFTRRMANKSQLTPQSVNEVNYFRRNFKYLEKQYEAQRQKQEETYFKAPKKPNLKTIPKLLKE